jgi:hypothetical protein
MSAISGSPKEQNAASQRKSDPLFFVLHFLAVPSHVHALDAFADGEPEKEILNEEVFQISAGGVQPTGSSHQHNAFLLI